MKVMVVFESLFGNTERVARAIAEGIESKLLGSEQVVVVEVSKAPAQLSDDVGLLVLGGPTHAFGMSRPGTRNDAIRRIGDEAVSHGIGVREWVATFQPGRRGLLTATFDTRAEQVRHLPGSAARSAAKALRHRGLRVLMRPESFYVADMEGPLVLGELSHARDWGAQLADAFHGARTAKGLSSHQ